MREFEDIKPKEKIASDMFDVCKWIRDNVEEFKLEQTKQFLVRFDNYFDPGQPKMIEHVYRGIKNSLKVQYAQVETISFARWLVYLLSPEKRAFDSKSDVESDLIQLVGDKSFLANFFRQSTDAKDKIKKKGLYLLFDEVTLPFLGSNVMFYYILTSVVHVIDYTLHDQEYDIIDIMDWQEAIAVYTLYELKDKHRNMPDTG